MIGALATGYNLNTVGNCVEHHTINQSINQLKLDQSKSCCLLQNSTPYNESVIVKLLASRIITFTSLQVLLINAVKDVASALSDLISATKNASGKSVQDPAMLSLKESAKVGLSANARTCLSVNTHTQALVFVPYHFVGFVVLIWANRLKILRR